MSGTLSKMGTPPTHKKYFYLPRKIRPGGYLRDANSERLIIILLFSENLTRGGAKSVEGGGGNMGVVC